jgi:hypothetical protein
MKNDLFGLLFVVIFGASLIGCENPATGNTTPNIKYVNITGAAAYSGKYGQFFLYSTSGYPAALSKMTGISSNGVFNSALYEYPGNNIPWYGDGEYYAALAMSSTNSGTDLIYAGTIDLISVSGDMVEIEFEDFIAINLNNNTFTKEGDSMVFYSEGIGSPGVYSLQAGDIISGSGSIKVLIKATTDNNNEEFGIEYGRSGAGTLKIVNFYINMDGEYCIYWFDGSNSSSSYSWKTSSAIKKSVNEWNELRIDYNTASKTFSFFINGTKLLDKTFTSIDEGHIVYYTSLRYSDVSTENPYRLEFKTTSPKVYP